MRSLNLSSRVLKEVYRDPVAIVLLIFPPVLFLFLFSYIASSDPNAPSVFSPELLVPGVIVLSFGFLALFAGMILARDRQSAFLARLLTSPLKSADFIVGYMIPFLPVAFLQIVVCTAVGVILGLSFNTGVILSLVVFMPIALVCIAIGVLIGSVFGENTAPPVGSLLIMVISILGGAWMDLKMIGGIFESIGYALPFAHAIDAARVLYGGADLAVVTQELIVIVLYMLASFALAITAFWWRTRP